MQPSDLKTQKSIFFLALIFILPLKKYILNDFSPCCI